MRGSKSQSWGNVRPRPQSEATWTLVCLSWLKPLWLTTSELLVEDRELCVSAVVSSGPPSLPCLLGLPRLSLPSFYCAPVPSVPFPPSAPENSSTHVAFHPYSVVTMNRDEGQEAGVKDQVHLLPPQNLLRLILEKRLLFPMWCISSGHWELLTFIIGNPTLISWMLYCQCPETRDNSSSTT